MSEKVEALYRQLDSDFLNDLLLPEKLDSILQLVVNHKLTEEELRLATDKICQALLLSMDDIGSNAGFIAKLMDVQWTLLDNLSPDLDCPSFSLLFDRMFKLINDQGYTLFIKKIFININKFMKKWSQNDCVVKAIEFNKVSFERLGKYLLEMGDYESQAAILETMLRIYYKDKSESFVHKWFPNHPDLRDKIFNFVPGQFEVECRAFLNRVNGEVGKVRSLITQRIEVGNYKVSKPSECPLWVDFNKDSAEISFYCTDPELQQDDTQDWEIISVLEEAVEEAVLKLGLVPGSQILDLYLNIKCNQLFEGWPEKFDHVAGKSIALYFDEKLSIDSCLMDFFGSKYKGQITDCGLLEKSEKPLETTVFEQSKTPQNDEPISSSFCELTQQLASGLKQKDPLKKTKTEKIPSVSKLKEFSLKIPKISLSINTFSKELKSENDRKYKKSFGSKFRKRFSIIYSPSKVKSTNGKLEDNQEIEIFQSNTLQTRAASAPTKEATPGRRSARKAAMISSYKTRCLYSVLNKETRHTLPEEKDEFAEDEITRDNERRASLRRKRSLSSDESSEGSWIKSSKTRFLSPSYKKMPRRKNCLVNLSDSRSQISLISHPFNDESKNKRNSIPKSPAKPKRLSQKDNTKELNDFVQISVDSFNIEENELKRPESSSTIITEISNYSILEQEKFTNKFDVRNDGERNVNEPDKNENGDEETNSKNSNLFGSSPFVDQRQQHFSSHSLKPDIVFEGSAPDPKESKEMSSDEGSAPDPKESKEMTRDEGSAVMARQHSVEGEVNKEYIAMLPNFGTKPKRALFKNIHSEPHLCEVDSHMSQVSSNLEQVINEMSTRYISSIGENCLTSLRDLMKNYSQELTTIILDIQPFSPTQKNHDDILDYLKQTKCHRTLISTKLDHLEAVVHKFREDNCKIRSNFEQVQLKAAEEFIENIEKLSATTIRDLEQEALYRLKDNLSAIRNM